MTVGKNILDPKEIREKCPKKEILLKKENYVSHHVIARKKTFEHIKCHRKNVQKRKFFDDFWFSLEENFYMIFLF